VKPFDELGGIDFEGYGDPHDGVKRWTALAALQVADVGAMHACSLGESLLADRRHQ
jgi:hypothetical protein